MDDLAFTVPSLDQLGEAEKVLADTDSYSDAVVTTAFAIVMESSDDPERRAQALQEWRRRDG